MSSPLITEGLGFAPAFIVRDGLYGAEAAATVAFTGAATLTGAYAVSVNMAGDCEIELARAGSYQSSKTMGGDV